MLLAVVEAFLADLYARAEEARKIANTKPFKEDKKKFASKGITPTQGICWSEASAYRDLARDMIEAVANRLNSQDVFEGNKFRNKIMSALDYNGTCFYKDHMPDVRDYFDFIKEATASIISVYYVHGEMHTIITALVRFGPVFTEMLLTNAEVLLFKVRQIAQMLSSEEDPEAIDVDRLKNYYTDLFRLAFKSKDTERDLTNVANYINKVVSTYGSLRFRVLPSDYMDPPPIPPSMIPVKRNEDRLPSTTINNYIHGPTGDLNQGNSVISLEGMVSNNFNSGGGSQHNNTGPGTQHNNTGPGAQNTGAGTQNNAKKTNKPRIDLKVLGENSGWVLGAVVVVIALGFYIGKRGGNILPKTKTIM